MFSLSTKKTNTILASLILILLAGSLAYKYWKELSYAEIGVKIGDFAPEIVLPDQTGKQIKLSELRGNYVLVDFWAAWCKPCRRENPNLMRAYELFSKNRMRHGADFMIYSVSVDENAQAWQQAITKDMLHGPIHVSDLKGWNSPVLQTYGIKSIPSNVLVNPEGKIIATKLRGEDLIETLKKHSL